MVKPFAMRRIVILLTLICTIYCAKAQQSITFDQAVAMAYEANLTLKGAEYDMLVADYEKRVAEGLYFPQIEIVGGYMLMQRDAKIDILGDNGVANNIANTLINSGISSGILTPDIAQAIDGILAPLNSIDLSYILQKRSVGVTAAKLTMPIYVGGKIRAANRVADIERSVVERQMATIENHLYTTLVEQYYGVVVLQYAVGVRMSVVDAVKQHLSDAIAMEEAGEVAHSVVLGVEYRLAEVKQELLAEQHRLYMAKRLLCSTLNIDYDIHAVDRLFIDRAILSLDYYTDNALYLNPILAEANLSLELVEEGVKVAQSELLPEVAVIGAVSLYSPNLSELVPRWAIGVEASIPLFNGLKNVNDLNAAKARALGVATKVEKAKSDIVLLVENEYYNVINALEEITTAEVSMRLADSYYHSAEDGFKAGVVPYSELMDVQVNLSASKLSYINSVYNYSLSLARLLEASGLSSTLIEYRDNGAPIDIEYSLFR